MGPLKKKVLQVVARMLVACTSNGERIKQLTSWCICDKEGEKNEPYRSSRPLSLYASRQGITGWENNASNHVLGEERHQCHHHGQPLSVHKLLVPCPRRPLSSSFARLATHMHGPSRAVITFAQGPASSLHSRVDKAVRKRGSNKGTDTVTVQTTADSFEHLCCHSNSGER
jgi:hypothetical protein